MRALIVPIAFALALTGAAAVKAAELPGDSPNADSLDGVLLAQAVLPDAMPPRAEPGKIDRNLGIALTAWERIKGYEKSSQPDRVVIRDFAPVPLADGSVVIPGLGVRVRETVQARRQVLEVLDVQEYGPVWGVRGNPSFEIGGYLGGTVFSIDQNLRTALSRSGEKKLRNGFSIPIQAATPYLNHKQEERMQLVSGRLRIEPMVRPRGRWLAAEPEADDSAPSPMEEYEQLVASFQADIDKAPCDMDGRALLKLERETEILETANENPLPFVNFRQERDTACAIATHGPYAIADLERLTVLRRAMCEDLAGGLSDEMKQHAQEMQRQVAPPNYFQFARIGLFDLTDPSRRGLDQAAGRARMDCVLDYLENDLFAAD
ncbi:hypothetical protein KHP62_19030 [Rhodobacteraceae bacterium NNCM2]|nr:hypothetical protein [Coraliihabitans acroporae]